MGIRTWPLDLGWTLVGPWLDLVWLRLMWLHLGLMLASSWPILASSWPHLGPSWPHLGLILASSWPIFWRRNMGIRGWPLDLGWTLFGLGSCGFILVSCWLHLGPSWPHLGLILASSWPHLGPSWPHLGLILASSWPCATRKWGSRLGETPFFKTTVFAPSRPMSLQHRPLLCTF